MRKNILLVAAAAAVLAVNIPPCPCPVFGPGLAQAEDEDPEITRMAKQHFKMGLDAYNAGKYDVAIKELKRAYLLKRLPPILLNIGLTYRKTKDYDMALYFYKKFLQEAPPEDKQRATAEEAIKEIEAEKVAAAQPQPTAKPAVEAAPRAKPAVEAAPAAKPGGGEAAAGAPVTEWSHTPLDAVPPGQPIDVRVQMPVMKGVKVKVYYRKEGQAEWTNLELKRRGNEKVARLPADVTTGKTFQYYVEAKDPAGTLVKSSGSEASPNIVLIDATARPQLAGAEADAGGSDEDEAPKKKGFSRDIENEQASFDAKEQQRRAMDRLSSQMRGQDQEKNKKKVLGTLGWAGVGVLVGGAAVTGTGIAMYALAQGRADTVTADSSCMGTDHQVKVGGVYQCPHFGPNPDPAMTRTLPAPSSSDYYNEGQTMMTVANAMNIAGPILMAGGAAMVITDVIRTKMAERPKVQKAAPGKGKKRKVRKVIEVEEDAAEGSEPTSKLRLDLSPVLSPNAVGVVGVLRF